MSTMNGVVNKMTKEQLAKLLGINYLAVSKADKTVAEGIKYASKKYKEDIKSVTKKDLLDLVKGCMSALGDKFKFEAQTPVPVENSVKPSGKKLSKKTKTEEKVEEPEETIEEAPKKKPSSKKKPAKKESAVTVANPEEENTPAILLAETFKEELEIEDSKYHIAHDIDSMDKLIEAFNNDETIVFAMYWSKRYLQQFPYFNGEFKAPKEFPQDLDLSTCFFVSDEGVVAYAVSMYTEGCYMFKPEDLKEYEGLRFCSGIEYQIYRLVEQSFCPRTSV